MLSRISLRLVPALLAMLLCAEPPAAAEPSAHLDATITTHDSAAYSAALPPKLADHAARRQRHHASLEEFIGIDDDAEQYLKPLAVLLRPIVRPTSVAEPEAPSYCVARPNHRACAAYPTGPPHA